jgi:hypothetical protein
LPCPLARQIFSCLSVKRPSQLWFFPPSHPCAIFFTRRGLTASGPLSAVFPAFRSTPQPGFFPRRFYRRLQFTVLCLNIDSALPCSAAPCSFADVARLLIICLRHNFLVRSLFFFCARGGPQAARGAPSKPYPISVVLFSMRLLFQPLVSATAI